MTLERITFAFVCVFVHLTCLVYHSNIIRICRYIYRERYTHIITICKDIHTHKYMMWYNVYVTPVHLSIYCTSAPHLFLLCSTSAWQVLPTAVHTRRGWPAKPTRHWTMRAVGPAASSSTYSLAGWTNGFCYVLLGKLMGKPCFCCHQICRFRGETLLTVNQIPQVMDHKMPRRIQKKGFFCGCDPFGFSNMSLLERPKVGASEYPRGRLTRWWGLVQDTRESDSSHLQTAVRHWPHRSPKLRRSTCLLVLKHSNWKSPYLVGKSSLNTISLVGLIVASFEYRKMRYTTKKPHYPHWYLKSGLESGSIVAFQ